MSHIRFSFVVAALVLVSVVLAQPAMAQAIGVAGGAAGQAGQNLLNTFVTTITGNIGFFLGLAIAFFGVWTWIVNQNTGAGILMVVGGVLITMVPALFTGARGVVSGVVSQFATTSVPNTSGNLIVR